MNVAPQVRFWVAAAVALALVLWFLGSVLTPFAAGMALGYVLDPFATRLERLGLGRLGATILILVLFAVGFGVLLVIGAPILGRQLAGFVANMPATLDRLQTLVVDQGGAWLRGLMDGPLGKLGIAPPSGGDIQQSVGKYFGDALQWAAGFLRSVLSGGATLFNVASLLVVTPVVAFYMLLDWRRMVTTVDGWL
ncbi:MAG: AI-2E family transporter, partial [Hyphomicrobiales bacterium]|nr:AI-2E family transporter [Hyphomicrobiales bacterium]